MRATTVRHSGVVIVDAKAQRWPLTLRAIVEPEPGAAWQSYFHTAWPGYRHWYLHDGDAARPCLEACSAALARHMPELHPVWRRLVELAGGDPIAARMLCLWNPPAYMSGCSQAVLPEGGARGGPALVRNYDYAPLMFDRTVMATAWGGRDVVGMADGLWGLLDGMNDAGLSVALAFGGRRVLGEGFGVPLVLRYLLQVCRTAAEAREVLARVPLHMAYNVTVVDRDGDFFTAFLGPDRPPDFRDQRLATNHQDDVAWPEQARATQSVERFAALATTLADPCLDLESLTGAFLAPPLRTLDYDQGFGTLYTAVYEPMKSSVHYLWPGSQWTLAANGAGPAVHQVLLP